MIQPSTKDIGRKVVYTGNRYPGGKLEEGVITSLSSACVFVRYGAKQGSEATYREDLEWLTSAQTHGTRATVLNRKPLKRNKEGWPSGLRQRS